MVLKKSLVLVLGIGWLALILACGGGGGNVESGGASAPTETPPSEIDLPQHEYEPCELGRTRAQIRAVAPLREWTQADFERNALALSRKYKASLCQFVVKFYADAKSFHSEGWDGAGMVIVRVDRNNNDELSVGGFSVIDDPETLKPRTDVLKPTAAQPEPEPMPEPTPEPEPAKEDPAKEDPAELEKKAAAKLRLADKFYANGKFSDAKRWYADIVRDYPGTEAAGTAQKKLDAMP